VEVYHYNFFENGIFSNKPLFHFYKTYHSITPLFQHSNYDLPARAPGRLALLGWRASLQW
jgi:hypothetical protein